MQSNVLSRRVPRRYLVTVGKRNRKWCEFAKETSTYPPLHSGWRMYSASAPLHHRRTTPTNSSVASSSTNHVYDHDVERYLQDSMGQFLPQSSAYSRSSTQLDWELGDIPEKRRFANAAAEAGTMFPGTRDDNVWNDSEHDNDDDLVDDDDLIEEEIFKSSASSSAVDDESYEQFHDPQPNHMQNESSSTAADQSDLRRPRKQRTIRELLASFNPIKPPTVSDSATHEEGLEELQLWLECEAQQEAVLRYQKVIDDARERKDFSSLSMVQRQIVQWFGPLQEAIESRQLNYLKGQKAEPSEKKFGPFICTLPPSKLAVIVAHEAVMKSIVNGQENSTTYSVLGVSLASMAMRIGQAVEDELVVHRLLHKRSQDAARETKARTAPTDFEQNVSAVFGSDESEGDVDLVESDDLFNGEGVNATDAIEMADTIVSDNLPNVTHKWSYASSHLNVYLEEISRYQPSAKKRRVTGYAIQRARQILEREDEWTDNEKMQLGAALLQPLLETAKITTQDQKSEAAFTLEKHWVAKDKSVSFVCMSDRLHKMIQTDKLESLSATTTRHKPMIVPPKPWSSATDGGYRALKVDLIRYHGCHTQREAVKNADNSVVFDGLNALGRVKWKINKRMLKVAQKCWTDNIPLGDIPSRTDLEVPEEPVQPAWNEIKPEKGTEEYQNSLENYRAYRESLAKYNRTKQKNMDLRSLRCSAILKLDQAEKFKDFDEIYFPYNLDFRGRAYPIPPHLSNVGSDLCRGMLVFAEEKPLGEHGLYWLKVHLANFAGNDKITFDERASFVDEHIDQIRACVADPFGAERWWMTLDDPFQGLATCFEIVNAIDSGDPSTYMCSLPVHMDGSCNGLQHYAALGRDSVGGKAVNLCATDEPQDVYIGVMHEVIRRVAEEAERKIDFDYTNTDSLNKAQKKELSRHRAAKLVNGHIDRGVVKRTVMTSVYGVTYVGAREQIQEKIEEKLEAQGHDIDDISREVFQACGYLALVTMEVIGDLFSGAKGTMNWLTTCARMVSQHGYPVAWLSPIGVPAIQPYRLKKSATLVTLLQTISLAIASDDLPINKAKQVTAFPPNYIHSLDSSHMLLTALEMDRRGLTFSAVHDSFWTHPCDVSEMNKALRDVFVDLYSQPLLERLKETWEMRYPGLFFPDLPNRGDLDLNEVKNAKYFFQ